MPRRSACRPSHQLVRARRATNERDEYSYEVIAKRRTSAAVDAPQEAVDAPPETVNFIEKDGRGVWTELG